MSSLLLVKNGFKKPLIKKNCFSKRKFLFDEITAKFCYKKYKKRGYKSFLNPSIKNILPNPNVLLDMEKSTLRTVKAIKDKEKIGIFGDYDVDGATSTALLGRFFEKLNLDFEIYIPDRKTEGLWSIYK